jgi:gluconolactonase
LRHFNINLTQVKNNLNSSTVSLKKSHLLKSIALLSFIIVNGLGLSMAQDTANLAYPYDPASHVQTGVPKGELLQFTDNKSKIFPGTQRTYWIYIPDA